MSKWFSEGFVKNENKKLLEENSRVEDLLDLSIELDKFKTKIDSISFSSLVGFIGKFGTGKTNFLNQYRKKIEDENNKWFEFDAWKYPERSDLWENFILEVARQTNEDQFDNTIWKIDWTINDHKKTRINTIWDLPGFAAFKNFNYFFETTPAKRTFELQILLSELFNKIEEKNIYIVVEDIDRSGDNWIFFLETLNHFVKELKIEKRIIIIVPIGEENYNDDLKKLSYSKCLDYRHDFSLREIKLDKFVERIFDDEVLNDTNWKGQITSFLEGIFREFPKQITMRLLKQILRDASVNYIALHKKQGKGVDWRLSILFETAKYIKKHLDNGETRTYIDIWRNTPGIWNNESIFSGLIACVIQEEHNPNNNKFKSIYRKGSLSKDIINIKGSTSFTIPLRIISFDYSSAYWDKDSIIYKKDSPLDKDAYFWIIEDYLWG